MQPWMPEVRMRAILASVVVAWLLGCGPAPNVIGDGSLVTEDRPLASPARVQLALPASLTIKLGSPASLHLEGEANLLPHIEARVDDGLLVLGVEEGVALTPTRVLQLVLTTPAVRSLSIVSLGNITAPALSASTFTIDALNRGHITIERLEADRLETRVTSSGEVRINGGKVGHHQLSLLLGRGSVTATGLEATTTKAVLNAGGNAWLWVTERLEVTLRSSGSVRYLGAPELVVDDSGSGDVGPMTLALGDQ
jgi:hypothetical protein